MNVVAPKMEMYHALLDRTIRIDPPLLNSANPWATSRDDLETLYRSPHTGAATTRTTLLQGFEHDDSIHQFAFFDPSTQTPRSTTEASAQSASGSINTLGYSPRTLDEYLDDIEVIASAILQSTDDHAGGADTGITRIMSKPFIVSVTGSPDEVRQCWDVLNARQTSGRCPAPLLMEINLSCPNIADKPPPAYSGPALKEYLSLLSGMGVPVGLKVPPYTYHGQFEALVGALKDCTSICRVSFITAINTLGSSLVLSGTPESGYTTAVQSSTGLGIGGVAGATLHPLALGNVKILRGLLDAESTLSHVQIIGVGGVSDAAGSKRMKAVGASAVAVATALGTHGPDIFREILKGL